MNQTIKGKDLMVFVGDKSIALATNHTFEITANTTDTTTKDDLGKYTNTEVSTIGWSLSTENLVSLFGQAGKNTVDIIDLALAGEKVGVKFSLSKPLGAKVPDDGFEPNDEIDNVVYSGMAIITSVNVNAPNGEKATYTANFTGAGELTKTVYSGGEVVTPIYGVKVTTPVNGTVSVSPVSGEKDTEVTITATPDAGYAVGTIVVKDHNNNSVTVTANKFLLPAEGATVTVNFVEE